MGRTPVWWLRVQALEAFTACHSRINHASLLPQCPCLHPLCSVWCENPAVFCSSDQFHWKIWKVGTSPGYPYVGSLTLLSHDKQNSQLSRCSRNVCNDKTNYQRRAVVLHLGCTLASSRELKKKKIPSLDHT